MLRNIKLSAVFIIASILLLQAVCSAKNIYVKPTGTDTNTGLSWASAKGTIQAGLYTAVSGDQVWVMKGTYVENITLIDGVALYGGFAGTETSLTQRNWKTNVTIIDGSGVASVVICPNDAGSSTRIDGFTIRNGSANNGGGGIRCDYFSSPTIANNRISNNSTFNPNSEYFGGGGIYCGDGSAPEITNNIITGNDSYSYGGGIYCYYSNAVIANNLIVANTADSSGAGIHCDYSSPAIVNNTITGNTASIYGGGVGSRDSSPNVVNTIIAYNSSGIGCDDTGTNSPAVRTSCVFGNVTNNYTGMGDPTGSGGNIMADPMFVDDDAGDYRIAAESPCVNTGDNSVVESGAKDVDGIARISSGIVDMGAYEYVVPCTVPTISTHPASRAVCSGTATTFSITASNATAYQWKKNGTNISGATLSSYTISSASTSHAGTYTCVASSSCGSVTSNPATLTVKTKPVITVQPVSQFKALGTPVAFTVTATGTAPLSYQWKKDGINIAGATAAKYAISSVTSGSVGKYNCVVTNGCGSATSAIAALAINIKPQVGVVTPASGTYSQSGWKAFKCTYTDLNGFANLAYCTLHITPTVGSYSGGFAVRYNQNDKKFYIANSNGTWAPGVERGTSYVLESDIGYIDCKASTVAASTNTITVVFYVRVKRAMCGKPLNLSLTASDDTGAAVTWVKKGTASWTFTNAAPTVVSVSPSSGSVDSSSWTKFSCTCSDANTRSDLSKVRVLINTSLVTSGAAYAYYDANTNRLYMVTNAGTVVGGFAPGSDNTIQTENAYLDCKTTTVEPASSVVPSTLGSAQLKVNFDLSFKDNMAGKTHNIYMKVEDDLNAVYNWASKGTIAITTFPPPPPPP